ncbi:hypothetical protein LguiB_005680 [Lonicera macranthoides]
MINLSLLAIAVFTWFNVDLLKVSFRIIQHVASTKQSWVIVLYIDGWENRWVASDWKKDKNMAGVWNYTSGIQTSEDYRFYAISAQFPEFSNKDKTLVFQFSIKHEQKLDCGGGYMKLLSGEVDHKIFWGSYVAERSNSSIKLAKLPLGFHKPISRSSL